MWIKRKRYNDMRDEIRNLKRLNISLMQDFNASSKENFELTKQIKELEKILEEKKTKPRKPRTKKEDVSQETKPKKTTTRTRKTKKEDK